MRQTSKICWSEMQDLLLRSASLAARLFASISRQSSYSSCSIPKNIPKKRHSYSLLYCQFEKLEFKGLFLRVLLRSEKERLRPNNFNSLNVRK